MAITIKELLAADTISQAADKINFNFDQLLLNGGGPVGPPGPFGPPGPIGGRGIRGSQWFDGSLEPNDPSIVFPPLEPNDMYLEGPVTTTQTGDGDVWEFNGTTWIWTGLNLKGDKGDPGTSADWGTFGHPSLLADQQALYPVQETSITTNVRSVVIGGIPNTIWSPAPPDPNYVIDDSKALEMDNEALGSSVYIHVPTAGTAGITFSGGDVTEDFYTGGVSELATIGLWNGDQLVIKDNKNSGDPGYDVGLRFESDKRDINVTAARGINISSANDAINSPGWTSPGDLTLSVNNSGPFTSTELILQNSSSTDALMKVGTNQAINYAPSYTGNIIGEASNVVFTTQGNSILFANGGASNAVQLTANNGGLYAYGQSNADLRSAGIVTINSVSSDINISAASGTIDADALNIEITSQTTTGILAGTNLTLAAGDPVGPGHLLIKALTGVTYLQHGNVGGTTTHGVGVGFQPGGALPSSDLAVGDNLAVGYDSNAAIGERTSTAPGNLSDSLWVEGVITVGSGPGISLSTPNANKILNVEKDMSGEIDGKSGIAVTMDNMTYSFVGARATKGVDINMTGAPLALWSNPGMIGVDIDIDHTGLITGGNDIGVQVTMTAAAPRPQTAFLANNMGHAGGSSIIRSICFEAEGGGGGSTTSDFGFVSKLNNVAFYSDLAGTSPMTGHSGVGFWVEGFNALDESISGLVGPEYPLSIRHFGDNTPGSNHNYPLFIDNFSTDVTANQAAGCIRARVEVPEAALTTDNMYLRCERGGGGAIGAIVAQTAGIGIQIIAISDERLKGNIKDFDGGLNIISQLKPRSFKWKESGINDIGFIAQETMDIEMDMPPIYTGNPNSNLEEGEDPMMVGTEGLIPVLVAAVKEQQKMIEDLQKQVKELQEKP